MGVDGESSRTEREGEYRVLGEGGNAEKIRDRCWPLGWMVPILMVYLTSLSVVWWMAVQLIVRELRGRAGKLHC
jgi:hypothetical protein